MQITFGSVGRCLRLLNHFMFRFATIANYVPFRNYSELVNPESSGHAERFGTKDHRR